MQAKDVVGVSRYLLALCLLSKTMHNVPFEIDMSTISRNRLLQYFSILLTFELNTGAGVIDRVGQHRPCIVLSQRHLGAGNVDLRSILLLPLNRGGLHNAARSNKADGSLVIPSRSVDFWASFVLS